MFTPQLKQAIRSAYRSAAQHNHEYITLNHLLAALIDHTSVKEVVKSCGVDLAIFSKRLVSFMKETTPKYLNNAAKKVPKPTSGFSRVLFYSEQEAHNFGRAKVSGVDVLAAMFNEYDCHCIHLLVQSGLNRFDAVSLIAKDEHYCDEHAA